MESTKTSFTFQKQIKKISSLSNSIIAAIFVMLINFCCLFECWILCVEVTDISSYWQWIRYKSFRLRQNWLRKPELVLEIFITLLLLLLFYKVTSFYKHPQ